MILMQSLIMTAMHLKAWVRRAKQIADGRHVCHSSWTKVIRGLAS